MDLSKTITPKSDQMNADDLISGPITITITSVEKGTPEQPVSIQFEGCDGRPYKPGKSMRRVLVAMWGSEGSIYLGRSLTLYCDRTITFGPDTTGGIRISHASDITEPLEIALTVKRGKRKPFRVDVLAAPRKATATPTHAEPLSNLPDGWSDWTIEERGDNRANLGMSALQSWWKSLTKDDQTRLKPHLDADWKPIAEARQAKEDET